jgi:hypothetical protein
MMNTVGIINHDIVLPNHRYLNEILGSLNRKFFPRLNKVELTRLAFRTCRFNLFVTNEIGIR